jgi:NitT/TauT family transport system ATP-binding protein
MIKLNNVTVEFENKKILQNLSFSFEAGKKYALMGASGAGKTTILNVIAGLLSPTIGSIDTDVKKIAYVFQEPRLYDWMSILENVAVVSPLSNKEAKDEAKKILSALGLGESLLLYPSELSGGMKQRVSIARAIAYNPDLLLLDEPFRALDESTRICVAEYMFEAVKGKTVIMVTHDINDTVYADIILNITDHPIFHLDMEKSNKEILNK